MSVRVDPTFLEEMGRYGAFDVRGCFNCGNCTAICPLSTGDDSFPRKMIRYSQIGAPNKLLESKELWLCYYCGECSDTCPRQAEPGEFMASARRYMIASCDLTGISRLLYTSKIFTAVFMVGLSVLLTLLLLGGENPMEIEGPELFRTESTTGFISYDIIHHTGQVVIALAILAAAAGIVRMVRRLSSALPRPPAEDGAQEKWPGVFARLVPAVGKVIAELTAQKRYRDCEEDPREPWYRSRWFIHWAIMWGFIGLAAATTIDYGWIEAAKLFPELPGKQPGQPDPFWFPGRLLGTAAGLLLMHGTWMALVARIAKPDKYSAHSLLSDWLFLVLLFLTALTGFLVEIAVYLPVGTTAGYVAFLVHVVLGMEIVVLLPFTKFAHAIYRPLALLIHEMSRPEAGT